MTVAPSHDDRHQVGHNPRKDVQLIKPEVLTGPERPMRVVVVAAIALIDMDARVSMPVSASTSSTTGPAPARTPSIHALELLRRDAPGLMADVSLLRIRTITSQNAIAGPRVDVSRQEVTIGSYGSNLYPLVLLCNKRVSSRCHEAFREALKPLLLRPRLALPVWSDRPLPWPQLRQKPQFLLIDQGRHQDVN
jgi:hypothetical protein